MRERIFQADQEDLSLMCVAIEERLALSDAHGFIACEAGFALFRFTGHDAERALWEQSIYQVRNTLRLSTIEGGVGFHELKHERLGFGLGCGLCHCVLSSPMPHSRSVTWFYVDCGLKLTQAFGRGFRGSNSHFETSRPSHKHTGTCKRNDFHISKERGRHTF